MQPHSFVSSLDELRDDGSGQAAREVLGRMAEALAGARSVLVAAHVNPDGDALGSEVALALALRKLDKDAEVVNCDPVPEKFRGLYPEGIVRVVGEAESASLAGRFEWCVVLDTSEPGRVGILEPVIFAPGQKRLCLDHHQSRGRIPFDEHLLVSAAPATACLVLGLIDQLGVPLDRSMAQALWIALSTDTGWFRFANAGPLAFFTAARLVACDLHTERLYESIYGTQSLSRARVLGQILGKVQTELDGKLVWSYASRSLLDAHNLPVGELDGVIDSLKTVRGARVVALIVETEPGKYKASLRAVGETDVERIAREFGGGGHKKAAAFRYDLPFKRLIGELVGSVERALQELRRGGARP